MTSKIAFVVGPVPVAIIATDMLQEELITIVFDSLLLIVTCIPKSIKLAGKRLDFPLAICFIFDGYAMAIKLICGESGLLYRFLNLTLKYDALTSTILM